MFKRNNGRRSETDLRLRRSLEQSRNLEATRSLAFARSSEQISRRPSSPTPDIPQITTSYTESHVAKPNPRFSLMRFRHASDSAIGLKARDSNQPPVPTTPDALTLTPSIITTAPTNDFAPPRRQSTMRLWRQKTLDSKPSSSPAALSSEESSQRSSFSKNRRRDGSTSRTNSSMRTSRVTFDEPERPRTNPTGSIIHEPPAYDDQMSSLPLPPPRLSESSRSTASSTDHYITTTTTQTTTTTTTFFRLPRRKKKDTSLFPLPSKGGHGGPRPSVSDTDLTPIGRPMSMMSNSHPSPTRSGSRDHQFASHMLAASGLNFAGPGGPRVLRSNSTASTRSVQSSPTSLTPTKITKRDRSSTMSSLDRVEGRGSIGRKSFSGMFGRIRRDSEPIFGNAISRNVSPQPYSSGPTSLAVSQEIVTIPERNDEDTPQMYLSKLFEALSKSVVASLLARNGDVFHSAVLKSYMGTFDFSSTPMDMALRKLLMEVELPSETQQIDRVLQAFADRYHECNPFIYQDSDQAYYVAFSLIMLHTDFFNKNNKRKMQKQDYIKNTSQAISNEGISSDILECFYHNITYTPFIRMEDEFDINGEKIVPHRPKRGIFNRGNQDGKRLKEPVDPYTLIIDNQLDILRPSLKDVVQIEDPYSYTGTASRLEMSSLHRAFFRSGVLQIMSVRSRPDAFLSPSTTENPEGADPGVVEIKVTKVGVLWRKEMKKKKTRSPWHEWGVILTGSQLYFFRNVSWVKNLMTQYESHHKHNTGTPVIFKPPLEQFKPDAQISTDDAVALLDKTYKKHKHAFAFIRHGGMQEYFIADSEAEMNDWLAKLNYAATFRTAGIRMRGVIGGNYEGQRTRAIRRADGVPDTPTSTHFVQTPSGEVSILRGGIDTKLAAEISAARREVIEHKITDSEEKLATTNRQLQTLLRNARHLSILTPIQPKTREQAVLAAGSLAAKLQWVRMEMWKLRCHRDILAMDMDEERKSAKEQKKRNLEINTPSASAQNSPAGSIRGATPPTSGAPTPTQAMFTPPKVAASIGEDITHVISNTSSTKNTSTAWEFPRRDPEQNERASFSSNLPRTPSVSSLGNSRADIATTSNDHASIDTGRSYRSPSVSSFGGDADADKDEERDEKKKKEKSKGKDKESGRPKIRKSLHRTLRETQGLGHRRGKSKDVSSEDGNQSGEKYPGDTEGLARGSGSFTVHGKKASVITFGSEWQNMTAEDRLRRKIPGTESDTESGLVPNAGFISRRSSQQVQPTTALREDGEDTLIPQLPATLPASRRGSHIGHIMPMRGEDDLPDIPDDLSAPGAKEKLIAALNGVKASENAPVASEADTPGASTE